MHPRHRWPPVLAGVLLGIVMLATFVTAGRGIGVSGVMSRMVATVQHWIVPEITEKSAYFGKYFVTGTEPLDNYLTYLMVGLLLGAFVGSLSRRDFCVEVRRGPRITAVGRLLYALIGGVIAGFAARLARGCTSGMGLVGGAQLSVGSWVFMLCIFIGGFAAAWFVRKQWI
jgi:uncharacterized membrane protein YedE/YeeE